MAKTTKKGGGNAVPAPTYNREKSVNIKKAGNGYVVSCWDDKGDKTAVAKSMAEAMRQAKAMMGEPDKK